MTHADEPKAGRRNPSCFFCAQAPLTEGATAGAATFFSCRRHSSFLSLCFPFIPPRYPFIPLQLRRRLSARRDPLFPSQRYCLGSTPKYRSRYLDIISRQLSRFTIVHISRTLDTATIKFRPNSLFVVSFQAIFGCA